MARPVASRSMVNSRTVSKGMGSKDTPHRQATPNNNISKAIPNKGTRSRAMHHKATHSSNMDHNTNRAILNKVVRSHMPVPAFLC